MGFDNECILNIQSLPGEYFCPVCRTLVYPSEALQTQCTHLFCKPCLAYIVATTHACPYDGYLVTEADSKPLLDSNKAVAGGINNIQVHCLYHRSGCQWQGSFSDCITHCVDCSFGNSPVVCNRCGTQIVHRQVQEHAQICPGVQPLTQQADASQTQTSVQHSTTISQPSQDSYTQTAAVAATVAASSVHVLPASNAAAVAVPVSSAATGTGQAINHGGTAPQAAQTTEQWYQQQQVQYQQYYQQYPGYDPYQQQYQQQIYSQPPAQSQPAQIIQGQHPQPYVYPQPQAVQMPQAQVPPQAQQMHPHPHAQPQSQLQAQTQAQVQGQVPQMQAPLNPPQQLQVPQVQVQSNQAPHGQIPGQQMGNPPAQSFYPPMQQPQQQPLLHSHQQQPAALQHPPSQSVQQQQPHTLQSHPQPHLQHQPHQPLQQQPLALSQQHPAQSQQPSAPVTGHQYHPQHQPHQQMFTGAPQQHPVQTSHPGLPNQTQHSFQVQNQLQPQQSQQMRPLHPSAPMRAPQTGMQQPYMVPPSNQHPVQQQIHLYPGPQHPQQQGVSPHQVYGQMHQHQSSRPQGPMHMHLSPAHAQVGVPTRPPTGQTMTLNQALPYAQSASSTHVPYHGASAASIHSSHLNGPPQISSSPQAGLQPPGGQGTSSAPLAEGAIMTGKINDSIIDKISGPADSQDATTSGNLKFRETTDSRSAPKLYSESAGVKIKPGDSEEKGSTEAERSETADQDKVHKVKEESGEKTIEQSPNRKAMESVAVKQAQLDKANPFAPEVQEFKRSNDKILSGTLSRGEDKNIPPADSNAPNNTDPQRTHSEMMLPQYNPHRGLNLEVSFPDHMSSWEQSQEHLLAPNLTRPLAQGQTPVVPDPSQPPSGHSQHHGSFRPDSYGAFPGQSFPPSFGSGQSFPPPPGAKMPGPPFQGPPGSLDASAGMGRRPPSLEGQTGHHRLTTPLEPDFYSSTHGKHGPLKLNGLANNPLEPFGSGDGRFRALHDDRLRSFPVDSTRGAVDRRQFEDDLKQFPRPGNIDGETKYEKYLFDPRHGMGSHMLGFDHDSRFQSSMGSGPITSRELPGYQLDGHLRGSESGSYFHSMESGNRQRLHVLSDDHVGRKNESHMRFHDLGPDFGPHRPFRSPGRDFAGIPSSRYGLGAHSGFEDYLERSGFDERRLVFNHPSESGISNSPSAMANRFFRNDHMRPGANSEFLPNHLRNSDLLGSRMHNLGPGIGGHIRMTDFPSNLRKMEPGNMSFGEPEVSMYGENFELARKKNSGTTGWCRICKIDCETVEGLDLHSQTMEHQKMAMDIVLIIKRDSGKKQKLSIEANASVDEANKTKKNGVEARKSKH